MYQDVYDPSTQGESALPLTLSVLNDHGLTASFFVETLFSARFRQDPLNEEIVGIIGDAGQDIQVHLHPEWFDEARVRGLKKAGLSFDTSYNLSSEAGTSDITPGKSLYQPLDSDCFT